METVEVVIRLPKDIYDMFVKNAETIKANPLSFQTINAVLNGTVLPKGHGRLIDADKFIDALFRYGQADDKFKLGELIKYTPSEIWEIEKILAKTVIEADREVEQDESD